MAQLQARLIDHQFDALAGDEKTGSSFSVPGRGGGAADDQVRGEHDFPGCGPAAFQPFYGERDGTLGLLGGVLAHRGEVHVGEPRQHTVVVADDRDRTGNRHPLPGERVQESDGTPVVGRDHSGGQALGPQGLGRADARFLGVVAWDDPGPGGQARRRMARR